MNNILLSDSATVIRRYADFASRFVEARNVDVWCPHGYAEFTRTRYPVLYMHDGQNLFDPALAFGGVDWGIDGAITRLTCNQQIPAPIVVGVWNTPRRRQDYMPQKPLASPKTQDLRARFIQENGGPPQSDAYLKFLVEELKPFIDSEYRTLPDQPHTLIMGSSMGGLASLYALVEYPHVFGRAGCLSTHWPIGEDLVLDWLGAALPRPGAHRLYFDFGTETLDAGYEPYQRRMDAILQAAGYVQGRDWMTQKFEGAEHSEKAWRARVHIPLSFLLRP